MDWGYGNQGSGPFGWIGGGVMMILFIILAIWIVRQLTRSGDRGYSGGQTSALEVLDTRFARGEIPLEDYTRDREVLKRALRGK